jgi:SAM-dependent methyltransferase
MLERGLALAGPPAAGIVLDLGCAAGRTTFELARRLDRPVLGVDLHFAMLRMARRVLDGGVVSYPRRRVGMVYDRRTFPVAPQGADHVDFWVCDALALPFAPASVGFVNSLNLLDCLSSPYEHLQRLARLLAPGGAAVIATPYDWSSGVTAVEGWLGGHSQRGPDHGQSDVFLRRLLDGSHPTPVEGLALAGEVAGLPWSVRLHDRAVMQYQSHLVVARRTGDAAAPPRAAPSGGAA